MNNYTKNAIILHKRVTKEEYYNRKIYYEIFGTINDNHTPEIWRQTWCSTTNPSARTVEGFEKL